MQSSFGNLTLSPVVENKIWLNLKSLNYHLNSFFLMIAIQRHWNCLSLVSMINVNFYITHIMFQRNFCVFFKRQWLQEYACWYIISWFIRWLDSSEDDGQIVRELTAGAQMLNSECKHILLIRKHFFSNYIFPNIPFFNYLIITYFGQ